MCREKLEVHIERDLLNHFVNHCQEFNLNQDDLIHHLLYLYLDQCSQEIINLKEGYIKMADINLGLCEEFEKIESEATVKNRVHWS